MDGYYLNSLRLWKTAVQKDLRMMMARYARLEGIGSPILRSQGKLIDFNKRILEMLTTEIEAAELQVDADLHGDAGHRG